MADIAQLGGRGRIAARVTRVTLAVSCLFAGFVWAHPSWAQDEYSEAVGEESELLGLDKVPPALEAAPAAPVGEEPFTEDLFEEEPLEEDFADDEAAAGADGGVGIPPVIDRPLGIDEGPRIAVARFQLLDAPDYPELGVSAAEVDRLLETWREQRAPEGGFTIGRLQELTEEISKYYRERGLILAQAILPVQEAEDGVVQIQIFEGRLGRVLVEGNELYDEEEILLEPFRDLVGQPVVNARIESALLRITDYPGLAVFGIFQPGQRVGEADLVLKVQDEQRMDFSVRLDNQGTQRTGRNRLRATVDLNNPTEAADRLRLVGQGAYDPQNQSFWNLEYFRHLGRGYTVRAFMEENSFDVGGQFAERQIEGKSRNEGVSLSKSFLRSRQRNVSAELAFTRKDSLTTQQDMPLNEDKLSVLRLQLDYDSVDIERGGLNFAYLAIARGFNDFLGSMGNNESAARLAARQRGPSRQGTGNVFAEGEFQKALFGYTRLQTLTRHHSLLLRSEMQWSRDLLVPLEQFSMGGPESVRAYGVAELLWDQAAFLSAEYLIDAPFIADRRAFGNRNWGELLQFSLFLDYAIGKVNDPLPNAQGVVVDQYEGYSGAGWSLRLNVPGRLVSRLMMAWNLGSSDKDPENRRDPQVWFDLTLDF